MKILQEIPTSGLCVELTTSQSQNIEIIKRQWHIFNAELKKYKLNQNRGNWEKYGITFKIEEQYFYMTSIPLLDKKMPPHFTNKTIPVGEYAIFNHRGKMDGIKQTYFELYKIILPKSTFKIRNHQEIGFLHFERYDYRFQWNKPTSIIEIGVPIDSND